MPKPNDYISTVISAPAQEILAWADLPSDGAPADLAGWQRHRAEHARLQAEAVVALRAQMAFGISDRRVGGVPCQWVQPAQSAPGAAERLIVYLHGGGYVVGSGDGPLLIAGPLAVYSGCPVLVVDYRLAPEHPFPAAQEDAVAVYRALLADYAPQQLALSGDSAGGGLVLSAVLAAQRAGLPFPAALALISPWSDLSKTGESYFTLAGYDPSIHYERNLERSALVYAAGRTLTDPQLSPVYAEYPPDFPPTLIQAATRDLFLSNCVRLQRTLLAAGVDCRLSLWEGLWHVFHSDIVLPEARQALQEAAAFLCTRP